LTLNVVDRLCRAWVPERVRYGSVTETELATDLSLRKKLSESRSDPTSTFCTISNSRRRLILKSLISEARIGRHAIARKQNKKIVPVTDRNILPP
jgi:hypothetical protein